MDGGVDDLAMAGQVLVDAVVDDFPHEVVQTRPIVDIANVHARPFADGLEAFENGDVLGTVAGCGTLRDGR